MHNDNNLKKELSPITLLQSIKNYKSIKRREKQLYRLLDVISDTVECS